MNHGGDRRYRRHIPDIPAAYLNLPPLPSSSSSDDDGVEDVLMEAQSILCDYLKLETEKESKRRRRLKRRFIERDFKEAANTVHAHYFCENPKYTDEHFRQRFRMKKQIFFRIEEALMQHDPFFQQRPSASYRDTISPRLKVIAALRMLCYGVSADSLDEYLQIGKTTTYACLDSFCEGIYEIFGGEYLREPNEDDLKNLLNVADIRNFPGMLGSLDCMHWKWKNCPKALHGAYKGHADGKTVILEAVASYDTWIWHAQFGIPGSNNDLNVLDKSRIFDRLALGKFPTIHYQLNGKDYNWGYYLGDGIYPNYSTIIKGFSQPANAAQAHFTKLQSAYRKDVERAFGILQARFAIVRQPARSWSIRTLAKVMKTCIILHNMIVEDERHSYKLSQGIAVIDRSSYFHALEEDPVTEWEGKRSWNNEDFWSNLRTIQDEQEHYNLRNNLVTHVWSKYGGL